VSKPVELDNAVFRREVLESDIPVLVDFTAPWCGPCRQIEPIVGELAHEFAGSVKVAQIDMDDNVDIASQFRVVGLPTLMLFDKGEEVGRTGILSKERLKEWIKDHLASK
jgi:thioredoxin